MTKIVSVPEGLTGPEDWKFTITVAANDGAPTAEKMSGEVTKAAPTITFGDFTFTAPGTYTYKVTETGTVEGVTNDSAATTGKTVTITVVDNGDGTLTATADSTTDKPLTFTNNYDVKPVEAEFDVQKVIVVPEGLKGPEEWSFDITVEAKDDAPAAEKMEGTVDQDNKTVTFGPFKFTAPGTYEYTITEDGDVAGVTNDEESKTVKIEVEDDGKGNLVVVSVTPETSVIIFYNTYDVEPTTAEIPVKKIIQMPDDLKGWNETLGGEFTFTLTAADGTPMPDVTSYKISDPNGGSVTFGDIEFTIPGEYTYTITESGKVPGITNDANASQTVTIKVVDNGDGTLTATVDPEAGITFTNIFDLVDVTIEKVWDDDDNKLGMRPDSITVVLLQNEKAYDTVVLSGSNKWSYTWSQLPQYRNGELVEYTIDELSVEPYYLALAADESGYVLTLTNNLVTPVTDDPPVTKTITKDKPENEDDTFTFVFTPISNTVGLDVDKMPMPVKEGAVTDKITIAVSEAGIPKEFGTITFYYAGTYVYTITEDDSAALPGYKYDGTVYTLTYVISRSEDGKSMEKVLTILKGEKVGEGEVVEVSEYEYENEYTAPPIDIPVEKVWKGEVDPEKTRPKSITVVLLADGKDSGKTLVLTEETEWKGVFEDLPSQDNGKKIEYTIQEIEVEYYTSTITGNMDEGFVITNICTYVDTGDHSNLLLWSASMAASMAGIGFVLKKKREEEAE